MGYCFSSIDGAGKGEVDTLFVSPECRGKGVGKKLIENGLNGLEDSGIGDIEIWVHPGNVNGISFYWRLGFATGPIMKRVTHGSLQGGVKKSIPRARCPGNADLFVFT